MDPIDKPPMLVRWSLRLKDAGALDMPVHSLEPSVRASFGTGTRASVLRGDWLGRAVYPLLTDVVIGTWTSATVLDLFGGRDSSARPRGSSAPLDVLLVGAYLGGHLAAARKVSSRYPGYVEAPLGV